MAPVQELACRVELAEYRYLVLDSLSLSLGPRERDAARVPTFFLCSENVESAKLSRSLDGEPVIVVEMNGYGARQLEFFSRRHLGERASVRHGTDLLVEAELRSFVSSGIVLSREMPEPEAAQVLERLSTPASDPCGEQPHRGE